MEGLLLEIEKSMHQRRSLSALNNGVFGHNSFHNYYLNPSTNPSINQLLLKNQNTNIMPSNAFRGSLSMISPPHFYSSSLPLNHHHPHYQPPLLPLPAKSSSTLPSTNKKRKKKKQQQLKPIHSNITIIPKSETKAEDIAKPVTEKMAKKEQEDDTEEEFLIVGTAARSVYTSISPPPPSSVPMPRMLLKPKINDCNAEALGSAGATDDLRRILHL